MLSALSAPFQSTAFALLVVSFAIVAGILLLVSRWQSRLRAQVEQLARWPVFGESGNETLIGAMIEHGARIIGARRAVLVWDVGEEPTVNVASWSMGKVSVTAHPPEGWTPVVNELAQRTFICAGDVMRSSTILVREDDGRLTQRIGFPASERVLGMLDGTGLVSAAVATGTVSGRIFFLDVRRPSSEIAALVEIIGRQAATTLDQLHATHHLHEIAAREERIRLAQDLHDGVLQSLTGIRFELLAVAGSPEHDADAVRARLFALERALAIEQRELRHFIAGLKPALAQKSAADSLTSRLDALRERLALEWKTPVSIRISPDSEECPSELANAVPLMVHEAVVNAMKHARPTRVNVNVDRGTDRLRIVVSDDGKGFPFKGHFDHRALGESHAAPRSLFDRVTALGGKMSIESSDHGSRIEMVVSL